MDSLSIIIPAYNEANVIEGTLNSITAYFSKKNLDYEIIVSIEGDDNTLNIVKEYAEKNKNVKYTYSNRRLGKGWGIKRGFELSKNNVIAFYDADNSTGPEEIERIISELKENDVVVGSRALNNSYVLKSQGFLRIFVGTVFRKYVNFLLRLNIHDTQCGYKVFKRRALEGTLPRLKSSGFEFDVELLYRIKSAGFKIKEVPIKLRNREESRVRFIDMFKMGIGVLRLKFLAIK